MVLDMDFVDKDCVDLDDYIAEALTPLSTHLDAFKVTMEHLVQFLKEKTALKIRRVVKGGSLERGTAIKGKTDSELILFLDDFRSVQDQKTKMSEILAKIERCLGKYGSSIRIIKRTKLSVQSQVLIDDSWFDVNISPSYDVFGNAISNADVYKDITHSYELRDFFSTALTEVRVEAIKSLPVKLKHLMRLLHQWNLHIAQRHDDELLPAYFVESLTFWCWKRTCVGDEFDTARGMKTVMSELARGTALYIDWQDCQLIKNAPIGVDSKTRLRNPELPLVLDPINPAINMCERFNNHIGISFWQRISQFAMDTNKHRLLSDVTVWG